MRWLRDGQLHEYTITDDDVLTLARAVDREGAPNRAVAWTLVQRFASLYPTYPTLADFVSAYSQPINPRWFPDGDLHEQRMKQLDERGQADEQRRAELRVQYARKPWDQLAEESRRAALEAALATVESPVPGAVHFRASKARKDDRPRDALQRARVFAEGRTDLLDVVRVPEGYGRGVNWVFRSPTSVRQGLQVLTAGYEPDAVAQPSSPPEPADPKAPTGAPPGAPPQGLPSGPRWGWAWVCLDSFIPCPVDETSDTATPASAGSEPTPDDTADAHSAQAKRQASKRRRRPNGSSKVEPGA